MYKVIGVRFSTRDAFGDFKWMITKGAYRNALFVYMENFLDSIDTTANAGAGSACIRPYSHLFQAQPRAVGVPTGWSVISGGFTELNSFTKHAINLSFEHIYAILQSDKTITQIFFPCADDDYTRIGSQIFQLPSSVTNFISDKLFELGSFDASTTCRTHLQVSKSETVLAVHARLEQKYARLALKYKLLWQEHTNRGRSTEDDQQSFVPQLKRKYDR